MRSLFLFLSVLVLWFPSIMADEHHGHLRSLQSCPPPCGPGWLCKFGQCVADPKQCGGCPQGTYCVNGSCRRLIPIKP